MAQRLRRHRDRRLGAVADGAPHRPVRDPDAARGRSPTRVDAAGLTRADVDFTCVGSCDYITGQAFSFVQNLDAIGAWPPKRDSHVEMDGAWALYEAWLRLQHGDIEIAVVTGSGRSSTGDPALIYPMEMDPYYLAPLGADAADASPPCRPGRCIDAGIVDRARRWPRSRCAPARDAHRQPARAGHRRLRRRRRCSPSDYVRAPLRRHDLPPITDGAVRDGARHAADRARELCERPGLDHRLRPPHRVPQPGVPRPRRLAVDPHRRRGGRARRRRRSRSPSCRPRSPTRSCCCARRSASATTSR